MTNKKFKQNNVSIVGFNKLVFVFNLIIIAVWFFNLSTLIMMAIAIAWFRIHESKCLIDLFNLIMKYY